MSNAITTLADGGSGLPLFELLLLLPPVAATTIRITARTRATRSPFLRGDRRPNQLQTRLTFASDHLGGVASCRDQTLCPGLSAQNRPRPTTRTAAWPSVFHAATPASELALSK